MFQFRTLILLTAAFFLFQSSGPSSALAASRTVPAKSAVLSNDYASALAAADRFLQAWQTGDAETGLVLLTGHARKAVTRERIEAFFSTSAPAAYEIARGKPVRRDRFEFPVMLLGCSSTSSDAKNGRLHRRFSSIAVLRTGNNDWAIDKLP